MSKKGLTPAAVVALASGDLGNALVAATPGGIEAQEAAGQREACANMRLPKDGTSDDQRKVWESLGFVFGKDHDNLFVNVMFPAGWTWKATEHSMHNDLLDDKGRKRAGMFYKAAFYDRSAHIRLTRRYQAGEDYSTDTRPRPVNVRDYDGTVLHVVGQTQRTDQGDNAARCAAIEANDALVDRANDWLTENYPNWRDPLAYWG